MRNTVIAVVLAGAAMSGGACGPAAPTVPSIDDMPEVFSTTFDKKADLGKWETADPAAWKIVKANGNGYMSLQKQCNFKPLVRSPRNFALLRDVKLTSFVLDLKMQSTSPKSPRRSLCIIFNYKNPIQFYYVHICDHTTEFSHAALVVDGRPRMVITKNRTEGVKWDGGWHKVRVVRTWADGAIRVYFDDMSKPILTAEDKRFDLGQIGIGSFDDLGNFDDITLRGIEAEKMPVLDPGEVPPQIRKLDPDRAASTQPAPKPKGGSR